MPKSSDTVKAMPDLDKPLPPELEDWEGADPDYIREHTRGVNVENVARELERWYAYIAEHNLQPLSLHEATAAYQDAMRLVEQAHPDLIPEFTGDTTGRTFTEQRKRWDEAFLRFMELIREMLEAAGHVVYPDAHFMPYNFLPYTQEDDVFMPVEKHAIARIPAGAVRPPAFQFLHQIREEAKGSQVRADASAPLNVDHGFHATVRYLAGLADAKSVEEGYSILQVQQRRGAYQRSDVGIREALPQEYIAVIDPETTAPILERIQRERNEEKAKVLIAAFALASKRGADPDRFYVSLGDLVLMATGYARSGEKKTSSTYWWKKAAEAIKYATIDLASYQISVRIQRKGESEALFVNEYLMHRPRLVTRQPLLFQGFLQRIIELATAEKHDELEQYVRGINPEGFYLGFPKDVYQAMGGGMNALETVSRDLLALKGPAFWLAYDIAFLRRWAKKQETDPSKGQPLLEKLDRIGYLEKSKRMSGGQPSYTVALRHFFKDLDKLCDLGTLEHPGATLHRKDSGRWRHVTEAVKGWVGSRGVYINTDKLEGITMLYQLSEQRLAELEGTQKKHAAHKRRQEANASRKKSRGKSP